MSKRNLHPHPPHNFPNKDILERVNFLTEISKVAAQDPDLCDLAQYLGSEAIKTAQKSKIRIRPKQLFCKNCKTPLIPPLTAQVIKSHNIIHYKCKICNKERKKHLDEKSKLSNTNTKHVCYIQDVTNNEISTIFSSSETNNVNSTNPQKNVILNFD